MSGRKVEFELGLRVYRINDVTRSHMGGLRRNHHYTPRNPKKSVDR